MFYASLTLFSQMWTEVPKGKNKKPVNKDRFISYVFPFTRVHPIGYHGVGSLLACFRIGCRKMFLRGDSVILGTFYFRFVTPNRIVLILFSVGLVNSPS